MKDEVGVDSFCFQNHINCRENRIPDFRSMDNIPTGFSPHPGNVDRVLLRERTGGPSRDPSRPRLLASGCLTTNQFCNMELRHCVQKPRITAKTPGEDKVGKQCAEVRPLLDTLVGLSP